MGRIASIDFGLKRLGIAISDERQIIAHSIGVIQASKSMKITVKELIEHLAPYNPEKIIVGNPLHMSGRVGFLADEVQHFVQLLQKETEAEVILWDERLSTVLAERSLMESGMRRKKRSKVVDAVCATIILQSYLGY